MSYDEFKNHGITESTPETILLDVGTVHRNLKFGYMPLTSAPSDWSENYTNYFSKTTNNGVDTYTAVAGVESDNTTVAPTFAASTYYEKRWNAEESILGATSGGAKFTITPEIKRIEVDGANVATKGLDRKIGEKATLEVNLVEITPDRIKELAIGKNGASDVEDYDVIESKPDIEDSDYADNVGFIGTRADGMPIIIIMDNALCTSGFDNDRKPKNNSVIKATYECYQEITKNLNTLPWHVYYPTPAA